MTYQIGEFDDFRAISRDELIYYYDEALADHQVRPRPDDPRPRALGIVAMMELEATPGYWRGGLARVTIQPARQLSGFSKAITMNLLDIGRKPIPESSCVIKFEKDRYTFVAVGSNTLFSYRDQDEVNTYIGSGNYRALKAFFIREPDTIKRIS